MAAEHHAFCEYAAPGGSNWEMLMPQGCWAPYKGDTTKLESPSGGEIEMEGDTTLIRRYDMWQFEEENVWKWWSPGVDWKPPNEVSFTRIVGKHEVEFHYKATFQSHNLGTQENLRTGKKRKLRRVHGLAQDLRYSLGTPEGLLEYFEASNIKLIKSDFIIDQLYPGTAFQKRQDMEKIPGAFWQTHELESLIRQKKVIVISHPWLSKHHPDPDCRHLKLLVERGGGDGRVPLENGWGVFLDYSCLWQAPRKEEEQNEFITSLNDMHTLYAHDYTKVVRLEVVPEGVESSAKYLDRGWCATEAHWAAMKSVTNSYRAGFEIVPGGTSDETMVPMTPKEFLAKLIKLHFTSRRTDFVKVAKLYERVFEAKVREQESLCLNVCKNNHLKQFRPLLNAIPFYTKLKIIEIDFSRSDFPMETIMGIIQEYLAELELWQTKLSQISPPVQELRLKILDWLRPFIENRLREMFSQYLTVTFMDTHGFGPPRPP